MIARQYPLNPPPCPYDCRIKNGSGAFLGWRGFAPTALSGTSPKFDWSASNLGEAWRWRCTGKENALRVASPRGGFGWRGFRWRHVGVGAMGRARLSAAGMKVV